MLPNMPCRVVPRTDRRLELLTLIAAEFEGAPTLALSLTQARRLWGIEAETCLQLLEWLVDEGSLARRDDGLYVSGLMLKSRQPSTPPPTLAGQAATSAS